MKIHCHVLESSVPGTGTDEGGEMVFDATGVALGGLVKARFRFTLFPGDDGVVMVADGSPAWPASADAPRVHIKAGRR